MGVIFLRGDDVIMCNHDVMFNDDAMMCNVDAGLNEPSVVNYGCHILETWHNRGGITRCIHP